MANSGIVVINAAYNMATANLSVDQSHGSQLTMISSIAVKDVHLWESPQRKEISANHLLFPVAGQKPFSCAKLL